MSSSLFFARGDAPVIGRPLARVACRRMRPAHPIAVRRLRRAPEVRDNEIHFEVAKSADKDFITIEGATHGQSPCTAYEQTPGQYGNATSNFFDCVRDWIDTRY